MTAAIITIGDEILIGQITDTNSAWIASELSREGIDIKEMRSISDELSHIEKTLSEFEGRVDAVIITGGLGPTRDDKTRTALLNFFGGTMVLNHNVLRHIEELFGVRGMKVSEVNHMQAMVPDSCEVLWNPSGTAPGMLFRKNNTLYASMPGVPYEMKDIFSLGLMPILKKMSGNEVVVHQTISTHGLPESVLAARISGWELALPEHIRLAYLPRPGIVRLRLSARGSNEAALRRELEILTAKLATIIPNEIYAFADISLPEHCANLLKGKGLTVATAESCTGGSIASSFTAIPGSSEWFIGSIVAYHNRVKENQLGVSSELLRKHGAVSMEVVSAMAISVKERLNADFGLAVSGIAGPSGGTSEKPVGTTFIAVADEKGCVAEKFTFGEHRGRNVERSIQSALNMLRIRIISK